MDWNSLQYLVAFAEAGSLSAAARKMHVEHATIARRINDLEEKLKVKLVDRRGRRWTLTEEGKQIITIAERIEDDVQSIQRIADGTRTDLNATVTISAPPALAAATLTAPLVQLHQQHPNLHIHMVGETRAASLEKREADIAVRLSRPQHGNFTITKLGDMAFNLYATPAYLAQTRKENWQFIGYVDLNEPTPQQIALQNYAANRPFAFFANNLEIHHGAARAGAGIAALPDFMAHDDPSLTLAEPGTCLLMREIWLAVHTDLKDSTPIRTVIQHLIESFRTMRTRP